MRTLTLLTVLFSTSAAFAQDELRVLSAQSEPRKMLYNFLLGEAQKHFDARRAIVAKLETAGEIHKRQALLKAKFIEALGGFPEKTPLNGKTVGTIQGQGFRVEKVIYESRPHHHVTANFYIPDGKGPFPGVLLPCGHSANGKAAEAYQRAAILMAQNGLAVLCYDPIGQGERLQLLDANKKPGIPGSTSEHTMVGIGSLLVGRSTATYRIWDGIRSLDYLASRPEVDPKRLGCTGNSGGGTLTAYLMALDDRILAAAPSCYITTLERLFATLGPQDAEQNITGQVAFGMEHADYLTMRAPRPTLMCVGTQDYFDINGAWTTFREAKLLYGKLGYGERVDIFEFNDKHGFSKPRREAAMRWMRRWLLQKDDAPFEGNFTVFKDADLQCTRSGQVLEDFKGQSVFDINAAFEKQLAKQRSQLWKTKSKEEMLREVRRLIALPEKIAAPKVHLASSANHKDYTLNWWVFETEPGIRVPGIEVVPTKYAKRSILVPGDGIAKELKIEKAVQNKERVLAIDLRGLGETATALPSAKQSYFGTDFKTAFLSLHLNRPLLGQRVLDVMSVVDHVARESKEPISLTGTGTAGPIVLHAAALGARVQGTAIDHSLISWSSILETPITFNQLSNAVPGALMTYDLPDLVRAIGTERLEVRNPVNGLGQPVTPK